MEKNSEHFENKTINKKRSIILFFLCLFSFFS